MKVVVLCVVYSVIAAAVLSIFVMPSVRQTRVRADFRNFSDDSEGHHTLVRSENVTHVKTFDERLNLTIAAAKYSVAYRQCRLFTKCRRTGSGKRARTHCRTVRRWTDSPEPRWLELLSPVAMIGRLFGRRNSPFDRDGVSRQVITELRVGEMEVGRDVLEASKEMSPLVLSDEQYRNYTESELGESFTYIGWGYFFRPFNERFVPLLADESLPNSSFEDVRSVLKPCTVGDEQFSIYKISSESISVFGVRKGNQIVMGQWGSVREGLLSPDDFFNEMAFSRLVIVLVHGAAVLGAVIITLCFFSDQAMKTVLIWIFCAMVYGTVLCALLRVRTIVLLGMCACDVGLGALIWLKTRPARVLRKND